MNLRGAVAIITGGATGVGAATAVKLAAEGCRVLVNYSRSAAEAEDTASACRTLGVEAVAVQGDVASDDDCVRMAAEAVKAWGRIDILVNSAGTTKFVAHRNMEELEVQDFERIFAVNVLGAFQMTRAVRKHMIDAGEGAIVNISSVSGMVGDGSSIPYAASKGALNTMTLSLARALAPTIRVNAICPDYIVGRWMRNGVGDDRYDDFTKSLEASAPLRTLVTPEDVAETALWLIKGARVVTGAQIIVDAGIRLGN